MALSSLLDIVNTSQDELGLPRSSMVVAATDGTTRQMLALLNTGGRELMRWHDWGSLITLTTITTVANQSDYPVPSDYHRMVEQTHWDRSTLLRMPGPLTPQRDRYIRERNITQSTVFKNFRQIGSASIRITPTPPSAGIVLAYEYVSKNWAESSGGTTQALFQADTDTCFFDLDLMVKDLKWRFMSAKGMDSIALKAERDEVLKLAMSADQGGAILSLARRRMNMGGDLIAGVQPNAILTDGGDYIVAD